jgi:predicted lipoprotein
MRPPFYAAAGVLALTLVAACEDSPRPEAAVAPEQASGASLLAPASSPNLAAQINQQITSVCKAYRKASAQAKEDLAKDSTNADLRADVKAYDALIDDACN